MLSSREYTSFTGLPAAWARAAARRHTSRLASLFPPKAPPVIVWTKPNRTLTLEPQHPGDVLPHQKGLLGRAPDLNSAAGVRTRARRLHLEIEMIDGWSRIFTLDNHVGLLEAGADISFSYPGLVQDVSTGKSFSAPLFIASRGSETTGRGRYSTFISLIAASAASGVSAAMRATTSPI